MLNGASIEHNEISASDESSATEYPKDHVVGLPQYSNLIPYLVTINPRFNRINLNRP